MLSLNITEIFSSVQGETRFAGLPTVFVRLAQCNLRCSWCDTSYSFKRGTPWLLSDIVGFIAESGCRHVCITGGEPLLQENVHALMAQLCDAGYVLSLETGGSLCTKRVDPRVSVILDIKCPGSGMDAKNLYSNIPLLRPQDEVKFVLVDRADYDFAKGIISKYDLRRYTEHLLFSPVHLEGQRLCPKELVSWILADKLPVKLNLQLHKYIWSPTTQGV